MTAARQLLFVGLLSVALWALLIAGATPIARYLAAALYADAAGAP